MRKYFIWLAAIALLVTTASAAYAIDFKMTGFYRVRGLTADDGDRNSKMQDSQQDNDRLFRPRFTATSDDKKIVAIYEFDLNDMDWGSGGRPGAGVNRFVVDFAVPGSTLRFRMGRSDWTSPDREIFDSFGNSRRTGFGLYGRLSGPVSLSAFTFKYAEGANGGRERTDADAYYLALSWNVAPSVTITPWFGYDHRNGGTPTVTPGMPASRMIETRTGLDNDFDDSVGEIELGTTGSGEDEIRVGSVPVAATSAMTNFGDPSYAVMYYALNVKAKFGIADIDASIVLNDGEFVYPGNDSRHDVDLDGWAALIRTWFTFGNLKVGYAGTFVSGDDDDTSATGVYGRQPDNKLSRFVFPQLNGSGQLLGPQLITRRRYHAINVMGNNSSPKAGDGGAASNGVSTHEFLATYQATKDLTLAGEIAFARSHSQRANIDADSNGDTMGAGDSTYDSSKEIGTEFDVHFSYNIYPGLILKGTYSYLWAGDYGVMETMGGAPSMARGLDDTWAAHIGLRYVF